MAATGKKGERVFIVGGGCTAFIKPRATRETSDMGLEAATKALLDAGITYDAVEAAFVGYCYGDSTSGQAALYNLGLTSIPITNRNAHSRWTRALHARARVRAYDAGDLGSMWKDRANPMRPLNAATQAAEERLGENHGPGAPRQFSNAAREYFERYGGGKGTLAKIAAKNHKHSVNNPYSQFRNGWTEEQVLAAPQITNELTKYMCSPTSDGAACCILASESFVHAHGLENQAIEIVAQGLQTDTPDAFKGDDAMNVVGYGMSKRCADAVFAQAGASREDVGVVELHDCFAANELVTYGALGLCPLEDAWKFAERGDNTYGGKYVINPSGGLEAKGHPLGATGIGMHFYIAMQLRNWAGPMQAPGLFDIADKRGKYGLVHNLGLGGAVVVSLLRRPEFFKEGGKDGRDRLGYNHAHECKPITRKDLDKVKSKLTSERVLEFAKL
ncbi:hypothetical protein EVG20_g8681 [Dentipellis fragilis]|uniref:Thiolase C-terminal domain-containing protein n=1 Tax=Dentipellis fragilis TaxID=205917 RepID=A0A4Y9Y4N3_9AGAM|nr:hypothetical protein EVG20_g8681 [Dentipellis fragilis]